MVSLSLQCFYQEQVTYCRPFTRTRALRGRDLREQRDSGERSKKRQVSTCWRGKRKVSLCASATAEVSRQGSVKDWVRGRLLEA